MSYFVLQKSDDVNFMILRIKEKLISKTIFFKNVDDAKEYPIVQQLFYLPFVKSVELSENVLRVERFPIVEWVDVQDEVCQQLENYMKLGGLIKKKVGQNVITVYAESTPNPSVMKFVANKKLVSHDMEFFKNGNLKEAPLAERLFNYDFINEIYISENFVSITIDKAKNWQDVVQEIRNYLRNYLIQNNPIVTNEYSKFNVFKDDLAEEKLSTIEREIVKILNEYVKPAVAGDGGNIVFKSFDEKEKRLDVVLQGACSGCPSSTNTLKNGIETMMKEMLPGKVEKVNAING